MSLRLIGAFAAAVAIAGAATAWPAADPKDPPLTAEDRLAILRRSRVWSPIDTRTLDIRRGPAEDPALASGQPVRCEYVDRKLEGQSPKFACRVSPDDELKVKYGQQNGEVFGEVAATRLAWALGFGADRMYPVRVICVGCPLELGGEPRNAAGEFMFDPAAVERKAPGKTIETRSDEGWSWKELDLVEEAAGGAPEAHRDALKLLAALTQHGDNKPRQQRLVCLDEEQPGERGGRGAPEAASQEEDEADRDPEIRELCAHPFMMLNDLGLTFGRADRLNRNDRASVNFDRWAQTPIWKEREGCVATLGRSATGSLHDPVIGEAGRQFLADLLARLGDDQIRALFEVARFDRRVFKEQSSARTATLDEWVAAFKAKRAEIAGRRCQP